MFLRRMNAVFLAVVVLVGTACGIQKAPEEVAAPDRGEPGIPQSVQLSPCEGSDGLWGYCSPDGAVVIPPAFIVAGDFLETGIAAVATEDAWLYIDESGSVVIRPLIFDNGPDDFSEGLSRFEADGKIGFFDRTGAVVIEARYDWARPFRGGLAAVCLGCSPESDGEHRAMVGGLWGFVDSAGEVVVAIVYEKVEDVSHGKALGLQEGEWVDIAVP